MRRRLSEKFARFGQRRQQGVPVNGKPEEDSVSSVSSVSSESSVFSCADVERLGTHARHAMLSRRTAQRHATSDTERPFAESLRREENTQNDILQKTDQELEEFGACDGFPAHPREGSDDPPSSSNDTIGSHASEVEDRAGATAGGSGPLFLFYR